jgi:hypothetical protein
MRAGHNCSSNAPLNVASIEVGSSPSWLHGTKRMHHRVFRRTPFDTIAENTAQEPLTEQDDGEYDEQSDNRLDQAQAIPHLFHVVASHVPPSSTCRLNISNLCCGDS